MRIKAVSFDADGTLLGTFTDRKNGFAAFFVEAAKGRGKNITIEELQPVLAQVKEEERILREDRGFKPYVNWENTRTHWLWFYEKVFSRLDIEDADQMAEELFRRYESGEFTSLYPDALPCLQALKARGIPMVLVSNFSPLLLDFLKTHGIFEFFEVVLVSGVEGIEKPDPGLFRKAASALGLKPDEIVHVGNEKMDDYEAAMRAGLEALLLDRENICSDLGIRKLSSLLELLPLLEEEFGS